MRSSLKPATAVILTCLCASLAAQPSYWTSKDHGPVRSREPRNRLIGYLPLYADKDLYPAHVPRTFYTHPSLPPVVINDRPIVVRPVPVLNVPHVSRHSRPQAVTVTAGQTNALVQNVILPADNASATAAMPSPTPTPTPILTPKPTTIPKSVYTLGVTRCQKGSGK